jgi:ribosomal protein S18 acetylase RimI-like enzyme
MSAWAVEAPGDGDFARWRELYRGYAVFYGIAQPEEHARRVWDWLHDGNHEVRGFVVRDESGVIAGLAHFRPFARPLRASTGCFLDDLYVDPAYRGTGAVDALLEALRATARAEGWDTVRWITADDNYRGRSKYDQVATRTMWITYDMPSAEA